MRLPADDIYDYLKTEKRPVIIYGMGNGADKVIMQLEARNIPVSGIAASDDFVRGQEFHGFRVQRISDFTDQYGDPVFLVAFGTCIPQVMENIFSLAEKHTVLAVDVPVYGENVWCMDFLNENLEAIERAYELFADEKSRRVYELVLSYKLTGRLDYLRAAYSDKSEVFRDIIPLGGDETYLDLGAYRGDTIDEFLGYAGGTYRHITALEPDRRTFAKLKKHTSGMKNVRLFRMGIWSEDMNMSFEDSKGRGSSLRSGGGDVAVTAIDTLYSVRRLSYLKMDVEGAERQALIGGAKTLCRDYPKLNIAVYHRSEDIFSIPLLIESIAPEYKLYLRQHPYIPAWDLNLYASPCQRGAGSRLSARSALLPSAKVSTGHPRPDSRSSLRLCSALALAPKLSKSRRVDILFQGCGAQPHPLKNEYVGFGCMNIRFKG